MLVVPPNLAGRDIERQGRVVVQVREIGTAEHEPRRRGGDTRADVDEFQLRVVARRHPGADVPAILVGHRAPGLVARLPGRREGAAPPEFAAGLRVMGEDDAGVGSPERPATPPRDQLAVGHDRPGAVMGRVGLVVEDPRLPRELAGRSIERVRVQVGACAENEASPDRDIARLASECARVAPDVVRQVAPVLPDQIAGRGRERLDDVLRIRDVQDAVVGQRRRLGASIGHGPRPLHPDPPNVLPRDLVERAVAPGVEGAAEAEPVFRLRVLQHRVGHGNEVAG